MKIDPLLDRLLAKRIHTTPTASAGVFLPSAVRETPVEAVVVSVGNGRRLQGGGLEALTVKAGDLILVGSRSGSEVSVDGEPHLLLREDDVLALFER